MFDMLLFKVFLLVVFIQSCASQYIPCNKNLTRQWTSIFEDLKLSKKIFLVLSYSTNSMVENSTDLMQLKDYIRSPIVIRPSNKIQHTDMYEISGAPRSAAQQDLTFVSIFTGKLLSYGRRYFKSDRKFMEQIFYNFQTRKALMTNCVTLFQTCQMTMNAMEQISVQKAWVLFISVPKKLQSFRIAANISAYIEAAEMQDYSFDEFGGKGIKSCEIVIDHMRKCKAEFFNVDVNKLIVSAISLILMLLAAVKLFRRIRKVWSNRVQDIREH